MCLVEPHPMNTLSGLLETLDRDRLLNLCFPERARHGTARTVGERRAPGSLTESTVAIVLAGGRGSRLANLTDHRAKPAVSFGGAYRLIDFTLSNCVHSRIRRICVCAQYEAQGLADHIRHAWGFFDRRAGDFIDVMPTQCRPDGSGDRGTADAVHQNIELLRGEAPQYVLVLASDHIYKMDYRRMLAEHVAHAADLTVGCVEVPLQQGSAYGLMQVDPAWNVVWFDEKPLSPRPLDRRPEHALASMGVYAFNAEVLYRALARDAASPGSTHDFGKDLVPDLVRGGARVMAHSLSDAGTGTFDRSAYWRDVGTLEAFWEANIDLTRNPAALDLNDRSWPILSTPRTLPPARFVFDDGRSVQSTDSLIAGGCVIRGATVRFSVLSVNVSVDSHSIIEESVVLPDVSIGRHCMIRRAVIDEHSRLPDGFTAGVDAKADRRRFFTSEHGITLVTSDMLESPEPDLSYAT